MSATADDIRDQLPAAEPAAPPVSLPAAPGVQTNPSATSVQPPDNGGGMLPSSPAPLPSNPSAGSLPAGMSTVAVPTGPVVSSVQSNETTAGQLHDLLDSSSPYLTQARDRAQLAMADRGLQNSSLAIQAGEQAAISAAVPIAASDAATFADRSKSNQTAVNTFGLQQKETEAASALSSQQHAQTLIEQANAGDIQSKLQLEKFGFDTQLSAQDNVQRLQQLAAAGDIQAKAQLAQFNYATMLADQQAGNDIKLEDKRFQDGLGTLAQQYANSLGLNEQDTKLWIERQNVSHADTLEEIAAQVSAQSKASSSINAQQTTAQLQSQYLTQVAQRQAMASQEVAAIYQTQGLTSAQQDAAVSQAMARLQTDLNSLQAYYQNSPMFDPTWGQTPPTGGPPVVTQPGHVNTPTVPTGPTTQAVTPPTATPYSGPDLFDTSYYQQWGGWQGAPPS